MNKFASILFATLLIASAAKSQGNVSPEKKEIPKNWQLLDESSTGFPGISLDKAYAFVQSKNIKTKKIIVAVIDSGIDTLHEDLKSILWRNPKEIPGNGIDDDKNGYVDDIYGWNFIGGKDGRNVKVDSDEGARVYHSLKKIWEDKEIDTLTLSPVDKTSYKTFLRAKEKVAGSVNPQELAYIKQLQPKLLLGDSMMRSEIGKEEYNGNDLKTFSPKSSEAKMIKSFILNISKANDSYDITNQQLLDELAGELRKSESATTPPPTYRKDIVGDDETNINDRYYGNNDVMANTPFHGTHCSGIIAAVRNNNKGMDGVASNVSIMMIRAVPDGDEHDKDIANAIRYAVDNGARVVSMSFGKSFSPEKKWVDEAYKYAESKGVLLVQAAGNDHKNVDVESSFPNPVFADGSGEASNVITVGASGNEQNGGLTASFSNYGKKQVDLFAPGVGIYSTIPGVNTYGNASGTSMACPLVAGVAAFILENYPNLTPQQVKLAIEKTTQAPKGKVKKPGAEDLGLGDENSTMTDMSELSKSGGIINAYEAIKYASTLKAPQKKQSLPKSTIKKNKLG
jgi:subtilisin family serine protease